MGTLKICIDAGHFGKNNNNPDVSPVYWESLMAWDLHLLLKEELEKYEGVTVITTREDQTKDLALEARGKKAAGCDLFLSIHSNACNSKTVDRPVCIYPVSGKCKDLALMLATTVRTVMETNDPPKIAQRWNTAGNADWYGVIRGAASVGVPGLILEHSFHTCDQRALWLEKTENLRKLAVAEAAVLAAAYGCKPKTVNPFEDVQEGKWFYEAVMWAYENGIVAGTDETHFSPNKGLTRAAGCVMLYKALANK